MATTTSEACTAAETRYSEKKHTKDSPKTESRKRECNLCSLARSDYIVSVAFDPNKVGRVHLICGNFFSAGEN